MQQLIVNDVVEGNEEGACIEALSERLAVMQAGKMERADNEKEKVIKSVPAVSKEMLETGVERLKMICGDG